MPAPETILRVDLLPHQYAFVTATESVVLLDGGFGAGKTLPLCDWALKQCHEYPRNLLLIGRQHYTDLADSTIKSFFDRLDQLELPRTWNDSRKVYTYPNGSEILFRHLDDETGLKNLNLGGVGIDQAEEILPARFDLLLGRLRRPQASRQMRLVSNPNGHDWLWQLFYPESPEHRAGYRVIRCSTLDNPYLPPDYAQRLQADYSEEFIQQYVHASRDVMLGYRFFDVGTLKQQAIEEPLAVGYFVDGLPKPEWRDQAGGAVRVYERYDMHDLYCGGLDIATGDGTCRSAGVFRNARFNRVAAVIDADLDPDELALQAWFCSRYFGNAVVAPERNGIGFACVTALSKLTANIFSETVTDQLTSQASAHLGWWTDARSRASLFSQLQQELRARSLQLCDRELLEQCKAVTMSKRGRPEAEPGFRDDLVLACGISGMVRKLRPSLSNAAALEPAFAETESVEPSVAYGFGKIHHRKHRQRGAHR